MAPITGIDIYRYSNINWITGYQDLLNKHLYFAFIKASEGQTIQDSSFVTHWEKGKQLGLLLGAYHYLRPLALATNQAQNFLSQYKKVNHLGALPPVVDIEWSSGATDKREQWNLIPANQRIPKIKTFLSAVEEELHVKPIIYTAFAFWKDFIQSQYTGNDTEYFKDFPLWLVDLRGTSPIPSPWTKPLFIQNHFGENAKDKTDPFDILDQDLFPGSTKELLNSTQAGLTFSKGVPYSLIVRDFQEALREKGFYNYNIDGGFGNLTEKAVKDFQASIGLSETGVVDGQTWDKLLV